MKSALADTELGLTHRVLAELGSEPDLDATNIGVAVDDGVITLTGSVSTYAEKLSAERAAKRLAGVSALASELEVRPVAGAERSDTDLARAVMQALEWDVAVPHENITTRVADGW